tara:strand:+ start:56 stop:298 length:243 start_codon:yes stop_codon:yes gene_type:complete
MSSVLLESWEHHTNATPYKAPECIIEWFSGVVYGHPMYEDGTFVITSTKKSGTPSSRAVIQTQNTSYKLGIPAGFGSKKA